MDEADLSSRMLGRIGRHVLVAVLGFAVGIGVIVIGGLAGRALFGDAMPGWWRALSFGLGMLLIPVIGIGAAFRLLRCPACEGLVAFQVNAHAAVLGSPSRQCRHCGKTIFDDRFRRRMRITQGFVFVATLLVFGGAAVFGR